MALFGVGLIGGSLHRTLVERGWAGQSHPLSWTDSGLRAEQLDALARRIRRMRPDRLDVVWAAGRAGFGSTEGETAGERQSLADVVEFAEKLAAAGDHATAFHLVSSVGGLFEGQRHVDRQSVPHPMRPYGLLKLAQERRLATSPSSLTKRVYRLSSVYGPSHRGERRGLIATVLANCAARRPTRIVGELSTLRDFVWSEDVGRYLARAIRSPHRAEDRTLVLASGKPSSIHEILTLIFRSTGLVPEIRFVPLRDNALDITVAPSALPGDWRPTSLATAIRVLQIDSPTVLPAH